MPDTSMPGTSMPGTSMPDKVGAAFSKNLFFVRRSVKVFAAVRGPPFLWDQAR